MRKSFILGICFVVCVLLLHFAILPPSQAQDATLQSTLEPPATPGPRSPAGQLIVANKPRVGRSVYYDETAGFDHYTYFDIIQNFEISNPDLTAQGCRGFVSKPAVQDYSISIEPTNASRLFVSAYSLSGNDISLLVNDPNGDWICSDYFKGQDLEPGLSSEAVELGVGAPLLPGRYDIWVGTFDQPTDRVVLRIYIYSQGPNFQ